MIQHPSKNNSQINAPILINFSANLALFWEGLGSQVGAKMVPNRSKNRSKHRSKKWSPFGSSQDRFLNDFGPQLGGSRGVRWGSVGRLFGLLKLSWSQDEPKSSPRSPKTLPRALLEPILTILGSNLMVFIPNLNDFRPPTWWILQPTNKPNSQSTNQPNNQPTKPYIQISLHP